MKVLIIENDEKMLEFISMGLEVGWPGLRLIKCHLGEEGITLAENQSPDIIIMDPKLPDVNGFEVVRDVRLFSTVPIIIVAEKANETSIVKGLELGADEFVTQPFGQLELLARVRALMRRQRPSEEAYINYGPLCLYPSTGELSIGRQKVSLTRTECVILNRLLKSAGHVVAYSSLSETIWGDYCPGAQDAIRVYVRRLRAKVKEHYHNSDFIINKPGVGYFIEEYV